MIVAPKTVPSSPLFLFLRTAPLRERQLFLARFTFVLKVEDSHSDARVTLIGQR